MNYLKMAQTVRQLVGMQGTGPSSVDATGAEGLFLVLVKESYNDIQNRRREWKWMRESFAFNLVANTTTYTPATLFGPTNRFKNWYDETFFLTKNGIKEPLSFIDYDLFTRLYSNNTVAGTPYRFTIRPKDFALIFPKPDSNYQIDCDYKKNNQELVAATDIPEMPVDYHELIVYEAVSRYAITVGLGHVYEEYIQMANNLWVDLLKEQVPRAQFKVRGIV